MNKTININLAGLFFHIDEDAYNRLQRYLSAVRRSFSDTSGADEIMRDIESRIAELFMEKRANDQQVISINHVEDVIEIMGQPEDYEVDEEIFEDPKRKHRSAGPSKQLFRDTQNGYIGGVSSGLSYYFNIDAIWVRILWVLLAFFSAGWIVLVYVIMWIFVPDAVTTAQRLTMQGKEVNISNIEEQNSFENFSTVADEKTDAGYRVVGQKGKRGTVKFFGALGRIIKGFFKAIVKLIGLCIFLAASIGIIAILISLVTAGSISIDGMQAADILDIGIPADVNIWWATLAVFFLVGIPLLVLAILGLKLLVSNLRSIGTTAKVALAGIWIASVIGMVFITTKIASSQAIKASIAKQEKFTVAPQKTLFLDVIETDFTDQVRINANNVKIVYDDEGPKVLSRDVRVAVTSTTDSVASITLNYKAAGSTMDEAKENANNIIYKYELTDSTLTLDNYFALRENKRLNQQRVDAIIALPEGTIFNWDDDFIHRYRNGISNDAFDLYDNEKTYQVKNGKAICLDCPVINEEKKVTTQNNEVVKDSVTSKTLNDPEVNEWQYQD
ncbi:PspC domain-containing protein [Nonlabens sp. SY33080]|uniref:PspC domain-containing protein n=1 Tax=Nonlabens sp. SY33080 TaxID=2719911 RepID=UPI001428D282|nr:PspC domain-containing protein [Nonlabens sp. SY33080]